MKMKKWAIGILLVIGLLVGGLLGGIVLTGQPGRAAAAPSAQTSDPCVDDSVEDDGAEDDGAEAADAEDTDDVEEEVECGPQDENEADEVNEVDKSDEVAPAGLGLTDVQAQAIVEEANPGASTLAVEFDRENGNDIWEVELDNGLDVKVDASSGQILQTETRD